MKSRLIKGSILFIFWIGLTQSFHLIDISMGILVSILSMLLSSKLSSSVDHFKPPINKKLFKYIVVLVPAIFISGFKSIYMILTRKIEVRIVEVPTDLDNNFLIFILAMSITLSPGTITIHREDNTLYVLRLFPLSLNPKEEIDRIKNPFEKILMGE